MAILMILGALLLGIIGFVAGYLAFMGAGYMVGADADAIFLLLVFLGFLSFCGCTVLYFFSVWYFSAEFLLRNNRRLIENMVHQDP